MLVKLSINTFVRMIDGKGYIFNQMTYQDRFYDETGTQFLLQLTRDPQKINRIVEKLSLVYPDVPTSVLKEDLKEFLEDLALHHFVVLGENEMELNSNEVEFSYKNGNMKTQKDDYTQVTSQEVINNTQDIMLESGKLTPHLNSIQFELTSQCNERCIHCYIPNAKKNKGFHFSLHKIIEIIDEFVELGGLQVILSGGEVLMHPNWIEVMHYCRKKDLRVSILSNLINLKDEDIKEIKKANVSIVQTSLYSMIPQHHDSITTVKGSFKKTKMAIEKLVAADIPVQISCPVMKENANDYKEVMLYAKSLNIKSQTDYIMMAQSNLCQDNLVHRLSLEQTERVIRDIIDTDEDYHKSTLVQRPQSVDIQMRKERFKKQPLCGAAVNECCIAENGDVYPCSGWQAMVLGNLYDKSLKEIWENSEKAKKIRAITQGDFPQCIDCEAFDFCSRCLVRNFNECNGNMFELPKHFCDVAFLNKKILEEYQNQV